MRIDVHKADDIGSRKEQQDTVAFATLNDSAGSSLLVLADGVGGQTGGAVASRLVVDTYLEAAGAGAFDDDVAQRDTLNNVLLEANKRLAERMVAEPQLDGMATTLVAAIATPEHVQWISVGDSHLYLLRAGELHKLNEDHSYAAMLVKAGTYAENDPELDQYRSVIASAVSGDEIKHIDLPEEALELEPGDILVAASDGLDTLPDNHIEALLYEKRKANSDEMTVALIDAVKRARAPGQDNISVIVARIEGKAAESASVPPVHQATTQRRTAPSEGASERAEATAPAGNRETTPEEPREEVTEEPVVETAEPQSETVEDRKDKTVGGRRGGNWVLSALVAMALLGGGTYWVLSTFMDYPGRGPIGYIQSLRDGGSPSGSFFQRKRVECVSSRDNSWWSGRRDCDDYMGPGSYAPYRGQHRRGF